LAMKDISPAQAIPALLRDGRYRYVPGVLDEDTPWLMRHLVSVMSANVLIDSYVIDRIRDLSTRAALVYAMKFRSVYDLHFLRTRLAQLGLPVPCFVFGMSSFHTASWGKLFEVQRARVAALIHGRSQTDASERSIVADILKHGGAAVMFLVDEKTFRPRYIHPDRDPLAILLDVQGSLAGSIAVVPLTVLYDRTPRRVIRPFWESFLGDPDRPGPLKRILIALRKWTVPELLVGEPVHLVSQFQEFGADRPWEDLPSDLRQELIAKINDRIRVTRGPERLSRTEIKEQVLREARVQRAVTDIAARENTTTEKIRKQAEAYVREIAAEQHLQVLHVLYYFLKWVFSHIFDGVDLKPDQFSELKVAAQRGSLIFTPCHRSHFDYLVMSFFTFVNQLAIPYIAAGMNLSFWPMGPLFRNAGAFFLRRSFKGMELYTQVFASYVKVLVREKFNIKFYIEGGRSRTGKLLPPRLGFLSFVVRAVTEDAVDDLYFVPAFLGYDQIPEESSYLRELTGADKKKEGVMAMLRAREVLRRRYGKVYVRFHEPISLRAFSKQWRGGLNPESLSIKDRQEFLNDLAYHLMSGIVRVGVVTPVELAAAAVLCSADVRVSHATVIAAAQNFSVVLQDLGIEFAQGAEDAEAFLQPALGLFQLRGLIEVEDSPETPGERQYVILQQKKANLHFYKNGLVNYLWPASLLALAIAQTDYGLRELTPPIIETFANLKRLLQKELIVDPLQQEEAILQKTFDLFVRNGWLPYTNTDRPPAPSHPLNCFRGILADLLEAYYCVLLAVEALDRPVTEKEFTKGVMSRVQELLAARETDSPPVVASVTVNQALRLFHEMGLLEFRGAKRLVKNSVSDPGERDRWRRLLAVALGQEAHLPR